MTGEKLSVKRILILTAVILVNLGATVLMGWGRISQMKFFFSLAVIAFIVTLASILLAVFDRRKEYEYYFGTDHIKLLIMVIVAWGLTFGGRYIDAFYFPAGLLVFVLAGVMSVSSAVAMGSCMALLLCMTGSNPQGVIYSYIFLAVYSGLISDFLKKNGMRGRIAAFFMVLLPETLIPVVFYYNTFEELTVRVLVYFGAGALGTAFFAAIFYPLIFRWQKKEKHNLYDTILDEEYPLLKELKEYSLSEYAHALRVCQLARTCALEIGADANLAAAGGLYYRIGKIYGEPEIDHAIEAANRRGFPRELVTLLSEYEGIRCKPSSNESAIVHMVDALLRKLEALNDEGDSMESGWNQEMVIYQTLNELSGMGIYDESNLTMNQFLKIRGVLAKGGRLV